MKLFVDIISPCPDGWILARTAPEATALLAAGGVTHLSIKADDVDGGTGWAVAGWIELAVVVLGFVPPRITVRDSEYDVEDDLLAWVVRIKDSAGGVQLQLPYASTQSCPGCGGDASFVSPFFLSRGESVRIRTCKRCHEKFVERAAAGPLRLCRRDHVPGAALQDFTVELKTAASEGVSAIEKLQEHEYMLDLNAPPFFNAVRDVLGGHLVYSPCVAAWHPRLVETEILALELGLPKGRVHAFLDAGLPPKPFALVNGLLGPEALWIPSEHLRRQLTDLKSLEILNAYQLLADEPKVP